MKQEHTYLTKKSWSQGAGGVWAVGEEKTRGGSFKRVWSRRNRGKIHKDTYYFKIKGPKKERELRMQGMGGGRFTPPVSLPSPPLLARGSNL